MKKKERLFKVIEDGEEVFVGTASEIKEYYHISGNIYQYINSEHKFLRKYNLVSTNENNDIASDTVNNTKKPRNKNKKTISDLDYLIKMLSLNNNTIFKGNIEEYIEPLKEHGIIITYKRSTYDNAFYLVERI